MKVKKSTRGTAWWKLKSAFLCRETKHTEVPKWGTCPQAKAQGGCTSTEFSIKTICCRTCCDGDAPNALMRRKFGKGASCKALAAKGMCTKDHDVNKMCCKTCPQYVHKAIAEEKNAPLVKVSDGRGGDRTARAKDLLKTFGKAIKVETPPDKEGKVWWKLPEAFVCHETPATEVPKWGSCAQADALGGCESTEFSIKELCCKTCCKGDAPDALLRKHFGDDRASCKSAVEAGYCTKNHDIKNLCCKSCQDLYHAR